MILSGVRRKGGAIMSMTQQQLRIKALLQQLNNPLDVRDAFELLKREEAPLWMLRMTSARYRELVAKINA